MYPTARIERPYRIRFDECGPDGSLRSSGYLRYAQDLAWVHSDGAGFGREWYGSRGLTWLIRAVELHVLDGLAYGAELDVSTEVLGFRRVWARRRSEFTAATDQRPLAVATIDWVLLSSTGSPTRVPQQIVDAFGSELATFTPLRLDLPATPGDARRFELTVRRSEVDPMGHVNNAAYLDYIDEHLAATQGEATLACLPRRIASSSWHRRKRA